MPTPGEACLRMHGGDSRRRRGNLQGFLLRASPSISDSIGRASDQITERFLCCQSSRMAFSCRRGLCAGSSMILISPSRSTPERRNCQPVSALQKVRNCLKQSGRTCHTLVYDRGDGWCGPNNNCREDRRGREEMARVEQATLTGRIRGSVDSGVRWGHTGRAG